MEESELEDKCIVDHPGFEVCCLNKWVLEIASVGLKTRSKRSYSATRTQTNAAQSEYVIFYELVCNAAHTQNVL